MTVKSSISLTNEQDAFARSLVKEGRFASVSGVVQQGLDLLRSKVEREALEIEALRRLVNQRRQGKFVPIDEMFDRVDKNIKRKRRARGV